MRAFPLCKEGLGEVEFVSIAIWKRLRGIIEKENAISINLMGKLYTLETSFTLVIKLLWKKVYWSTTFRWGEKS